MRQVTTLWSRRAKRAEVRFAQKLRDSKTLLPANVLIGRVLKRLRVPTEPKWLLLPLGVLLLILCGCASAPRPCPPAIPPAELMIPPPPPGSMTTDLEAILRRGQTSGPSSTRLPRSATQK